MDKPISYEIKEFNSQSAFRTWLTAHHEDYDGIWLRIYKKASNVVSVTYAEALDEALCFGWIDGQKKSYDELSFLQKFTPRRSRSMWSKRNIEHITRLKETGQMTPKGLLEVEKAQADGRWAAAYDTPTDMQVPDYFLRELGKHPKAESFYTTLNKSNRYAIAWRLQTAKSEATRLRRMEKIIATLNEGKRVHT